MSDAPAPPAPPAAGGSARLLMGACALGLLGVAFSLAHLIWATPLLFSLFMIVGQGSFGAALVLYGIAVVRDLKRKNVL